MACSLDKKASQWEKIERKKSPKLMFTYLVNVAFSSSAFHVVVLKLWDD